MRFQRPCVYNRRITQVFRRLGIEFTAPEALNFTLTSKDGPQIEIMTTVEQLQEGVNSRVVLIDFPKEIHGHRISVPQIKYELTEVGNPQDLDYALFELPLYYRNDLTRRFFPIRTFHNGSSRANIVLHNEVMRKLVVLGQELLQKNYVLVGSKAILTP